MSFIVLCTSRACESARVVRLCSSRLQQSVRVLGLCSSTIDESARSQRPCASSFDESASEEARSGLQKVTLYLSQSASLDGFCRGNSSRHSVLSGQKAALSEQAGTILNRFTHSARAPNGESARSVSPYLLIRRRFIDPVPPIERKSATTQSHSRRMPLPARLVSLESEHARSRAARESRTRANTARRARRTSTDTISSDPPAPLDEIPRVPEHRGPPRHLDHPQVTPPAAPSAPFAGLPRAKLQGGMTVPGVTSEPAATNESSPTTAPSSTVLPIPTRHRCPMVHA